MLELDCWKCLLRALPSSCGQDFSLASLSTHLQGPVHSSLGVIYLGPPAQQPAKGRGLRPALPLTRGQHVRTKPRTEEKVRSVPLSVVSDSLIPGL